jgi:cyclopropane-fatty-acyl-phospholipid synthase
MTFADKMIKPEEMDIHAPKNSAAYLMALTAKHLPGSWLPYGSEMLIKDADPHFKMINISSGRADYIETIRVWRKMLRKFSFRKYALYAKLLWELMFKKDFRHLINVFRISPIMRCFEMDIMNHYRIVFEKK